MTVIQPATMTTSDSNDDQPALFSVEEFRSGQTIGRLLADVSTRLIAALDAEAEPLGITAAQWIILVRIANGCSPTAAELCRLSRYDTGSMTRMLDRLEDKGLIRRLRSCDDRRAIHLELTEAGHALYPQLPAVSVAVHNHMLKGFSADEVDQLKASLRKILANAETPYTPTA